MTEPTTQAGLLRREAAHAQALNTLKEWVMLGSDANAIAGDTDGLEALIAEAIESAVETERAACEAIARDPSHASFQRAARIADAIASRARKVE